jgi:hypothetical protein
MNNPYDQNVIKFLSPCHAEVNELKARDKNFLAGTRFQISRTINKEEKFRQFFPPCFGISDIEIQLPIAVTKSFF